MLGTMQQVKAVERRVIEAAATGSADAALRAFALHPLVDSVSTARRLLAGLPRRHARGRRPPVLTRPVGGPTILAQRPPPPQPTPEHKAA